MSAVPKSDADKAHIALRMLANRAPVADIIARSGLTELQVSQLAARRRPHCPTCEDTEFLMKSVTNRDEIARRVGLSVASLQRHAQKHGLVLPESMDEQLGRSGAKLVHKATS